MKKRIFKKYSWFESKPSPVKSFSEKAIYPLFTGEKDVIKKSKTYSYDQEALILASAGSIRHISYFSGKFAVSSSQIYVLSPKNEYIFWLFETIENFINKMPKGKSALTGEIKDLEVALPPENLLYLFNSFARPIQMEIDNLNKKQEALEKIKIELIQEVQNKESLENGNNFSIYKYFWALHIFLK